MKIILALFAAVLFTEFSLARGHRQSNKEVSNFAEAKKFLNQNIDLYDNKTIYCSCTVNKKNIDIQSCGYKLQTKSKKATQLEWEHVVPAEAFGKSFAEWRSGADTCFKKGKKFKGRKCAETNPEFDKMESDLYNLFPEIGELNRIRSNYSMAALTSSEKNFGGCKVKLDDRKFEPQDASKGIVARTYLNFDNRYKNRGVISEKNRPLFEAWNKHYPVTELECRRWKSFEKKNGYTHLFADQCKKLD